MSHKINDVMPRQAYIIILLLHYHYVLIIFEEISWNLSYLYFIDLVFE